MDQWCSGELMNLLRLSVVLLVGLTAVARAESSSEAGLAIKADLAKAQAALAQHNTSAVIEALDDTRKYSSNADGESLQALIDFEDRFRDTLAETTTEPTVLSPPISSKPVPPPPDQPAPPVPAASTQSLSGLFPESVPAPASPVSPPTPEPSADTAPLSSPPPTLDPKSEPKIALPPLPLALPRSPAETGLARPRAPVSERNAWSQRHAPSAQQPPRLALGARSWPYENHREIEGTVTAPRPGPVPEPPFLPDSAPTSSAPD